MAHGVGLSERLRQVREHRRISQSRLARAMSVSVGTIQNYEHGRAAISIDRIEELARALQCESADLLAEPGSPLPRYRFRYRSPMPRPTRQLILNLDDEEKKSPDANRGSKSGR